MSEEEKSDSEKEEKSSSKNEEKSSSKKEEKNNSKNGGKGSLKNNKSTKSKSAKKRATKSNLLKIGKLSINKIEIFYLVILILDLIAYFSLNKYINMIILFFAFMSVALILVYFMNLLFDKKDNREKNINNILSTTILIHSLVIGILLGQICNCGYHYFHIIPIYIFAIAQLVFYHVCVLNYKNKKNLTYLFVCFLIMNVVFITVILLSKIDMTAIHNSMHIL